MGLYADHIFPRLMDWVMRTPRFQEQRQQALASVSGTVLEIGFGTGLNLSHYPSTVTWLTAIEPGHLLDQRVAARNANLTTPVEIFRYRAESLPWEDERFDCAVSTWTLCTIRDPLRALGEIRRVLKPGGKFVFLEHGRSDDPKVARWQTILNPFQRVFACGCNLNRRIDRLIEDGGFTVERLDRFVMEGLPRPGADMYRGVASPKPVSAQYRER
jgi:ubiquinone/menaquinone biosynthesis C-methylase UbiE